MFNHILRHISTLQTLIRHRKLNFADCACKHLRYTIVTFSVLCAVDGGFIEPFVQLAVPLLGETHNFDRGGMTRIVYICAIQP